MNHPDILKEEYVIMREWIDGLEGEEQSFEQTFILQHRRWEQWGHGWLICFCLDVTYMLSVLRVDLSCL